MPADGGAHGQVPARAHNGRTASCACAETRVCLGPTSPDSICRSSDSAHEHLTAVVRVGTTENAIDHTKDVTRDVGLMSYPWKKPRDGCLWGICGIYFAPWIMVVCS